MCECLAWHHPLWRLVARRCGVRPLLVWGIVSALRDDPLLEPLTVKERVTVFAEGSGEKPLTIALVIAGLQQVGIVDDDGQLIEPRVDQDVTLSRDRHVTGHDVTLACHDQVSEDDVPNRPHIESEIERIRRLARDRQRRRRARLRSVTPVTLVTPAIEKEEEGDLLLSEDASARASEQSMAWPQEYVRKQGWCLSVMRRAETAGMLSRDVAGRLWAALQSLRPDRSLVNWGLPRAVNDELDRLDKQLRERGQGPPARNQPTLMLPIPGGNASTDGEYDPAKHEARIARQREAVARLQQREAG